MRCIKPLCLFLAVIAAAVAFDVCLAWRLGLNSPRCPECGRIMSVRDDGVLRFEDCECGHGTIRQVGPNNCLWK